MADEKLIRDAYDFMGKQPRNPQLAFEFLQCAKNDLEASKALYAMKKYDLAVYHLQQSVEKVTKSFLLRTGIMIKEDLIKSGHHTLKAFLKFFENQGLMDVLKPLEPRLPTPIEETKKKAIACAFQDPNAYTKLDKNAIGLIFNISELFIEKFADDVNLLNEENIKEVKKIANINSKKVTLQDKKKVKIVRNVGKSMAKLFFLAMITFPHESSTRYPGNPNLNPVDYTKKLGIVAAFKLLVKETFFVVNSFERLYAKELR